MMTGRIHRFALCATLVLAACSRGADADPAEVLEKAATAAQQLRSASFDAEFSYDSPVLRVDGSADGTLADGGRRMSFGFDAAMSMREEGVDRTVTARGDVIVAGENEAYVRIGGVEGSVLFLPGIGLVPEQALNKWIRAGDASAPVDEALTPDPAFIARQARTLVVTDDRSFEKIDGRSCYVYDVAIDQAKAVAFLEETARARGEPFDRAAAETFLSSYESAGTVYIDAETSVIRRIDWTFGAAPGQPDVHGSFSLRLHDHDEPVEISPPTDALPVDQLLPGSSLLAL